MLFQKPTFKCITYQVLIRKTRYNKWRVHRWRNEKHVDWCISTSESQWSATSIIVHFLNMHNQKYVPINIVGLINSNSSIKYVKSYAIFVNFQEQNHNRFVYTWKWICTNQKSTFLSGNPLSLFIFHNLVHRYRIAAIGESFLMIPP